jgi:serine/threonine-protein kinase
MEVFMQRLLIDPRHWTDLNRLLDVALELPLTERDRWLATLDAQYEWLKPQLGDLLSRAARMGTLDALNTLPKLDDISASDAAVEAPGSLVGPYRLIRELGAGGMGSVWLAERTDGLINRPVALKLPHIASRRIGLAERMAREREILATLTHPNIARLYDAGVTAEGRPYLALEYVEGQPIDVYCDERGLDAPSRLKLFLQVSDAVAYAHAKLIIHRDLKPANILVTNAGEVRLLDFGVAKLLDEGQAKATQLTALSGRALTLDYASPEQICGEPLTIATDVYSLGVVLYEVLSGAKPYRLKRGSSAALEEAILQAEPVKPSDAAKPMLRRALQGDVDCIVLKALKKKADARYATINELADDISRKLARRPIRARPDGTWYRVRMFVVRNRAAVSIAVTVAVVVLLSLATALRQGQVATQEAKRAAEVKQLLVSIFQGADPFKGTGEPLSAVDLLRQARARFDTTRIDDPAIRLELLNTLGESMLNLDDDQEAMRVLEHAAQLIPAVGAQELQSLRARRLLAEAKAKRGQAQPARQELDAILVLLNTQPSRYPEELVSALVQKAQIENLEGLYEAALATASQALKASEAHLGAKTPQAVSALLQISHAHDYLRRSNESLNAARAAYRMAQEVYGSHEGHPGANAARMQYAIALVDQDQIEEAVGLMKISLAAATKLYGPRARIVGHYHAAMVQYLISCGRISEALEHSQLAMEIHEPLLEPGSSRHAALLDARGLALLSARRAAESVPISTRAREYVAELLGPEHESVFVLSVHRARGLALLGRLDEARRELQWVIDRYARAGKSTLSTPLHYLGFVERMSGEFSKALELQQRALASIRPGPRARRASAKILTEIALLRLELNEVDAAEASVAQAIAIFEEKFVSKPPEYMDALLAAARISLARGKAEDALPLLQVVHKYWASIDPGGPSAKAAQRWLDHPQLTRPPR